MADYSKQYCDKYDPEFPCDFDFEELVPEPDQVCSVICEGFGSVAVKRELDGTIYLAFWTDDTMQDVAWVKLSEVTNTTYIKIRNENKDS